MTDIDPATESMNRTWRKHIAKLVIQELIELLIAVAVVATIGALIIWLWK